MSHDHLPINTEKVESDESLKTYSLNGQEVQLTEAQARALNAQLIGHGGDLGLEHPADGAIPITHEIPADDIPQKMDYNRKDKKQARRIQGKKWHERTSVRIGGAVAGLVATAGVTMGVLGDGNAEKQDRSPGVSAPANNEASEATDPWAWEEEPTQAPSAEVTTVPEVIDMSYIQSIDSQDLSDEVITYSTNPVEVASNTPKQAAEHLLQDWKLYWLSGDTSQSNDISQKETPESIAIGEKQLDTIFGPAEFRDQEKLLWDWVTGTREYLTLNMEYLITDNGYPENARLNNDFKFLSEKDLGNGSIEFLVENSWSSNMNELDPSISSRDIDMPNFTTNRYITVSQYEGNYHITEIRSEAAE